MVASVDSACIVMIEELAFGKWESPDKNYLLQWIIICILNASLRVSSIFSMNQTNIYGSGHETVAVLLPGFAINW